MCIAILNKSAVLPYEYVRTSWENNNDGAGLLYVGASGKMEAFKEATSLKRFWKKYKEVRAASALPVVLHFRIGTSGNFADYNLHPFLVNDALGFVHNGIISQHCERDSSKSDTALFNDVVVTKLDSDFVRDKYLQTRMEKYVGRWNKLIFMNDDADITIINEAQGEWVNDQWFSNDSWCTSNRYHGHIKM